MTQSTEFRSETSQQAAEEVDFALILGGAALQRCGKCIVLSVALAAEVTLSAWELAFRSPLDSGAIFPQDGP